MWVKLPGMVYLPLNTPAGAQIHKPRLERIVPDDTQLLLGRVLPRERVSQVHQGLRVEQAETKAAVDHQPGAVPLPPGVVGQRVKLGGPDHDVLQVSPRKIRAERAKREQGDGSAR